MLVLSVVVPTRNERENIGLLIQRLEAALSDLPCALIFVDDSDDETPQMIRRLTFLLHLSRLLWEVPQAGRAWKFAFVGALGALVNLSLLFLLSATAHLSVAGIGGATALNFIAGDVWVFRPLTAGKEPLGT